MKISKGQFAGGAGVNDGILSDILRGIAQTSTIRLAAGVADLVDSSGGGVGNNTIADVPNFTPSAVSGSNAVAKAEAEAGAVNVLNGLANLIAQANSIRAVVPEAFTALVNSTGGVPGGSNTIAAIDVSATGTNTALASAAGMNTLYRALRSRLAQMAVYVNKLAVATGLTPLTIGLTNYDASASNVFAAVSTNTGTAVTGASAADATACVTKVEWDARQLLLANAIADMAAKMNAMTADANATKPLPLVAI